MRFFLVLVFSIAQYPFCCEAINTLIYKLESGTYGLADLHANSAKGFQLFIRTFKRNKGYQDGLPQEEKSSSPAYDEIDNSAQSSEETGNKKFQFNKKDVSMFKGLIWFRQRNLDESLESYNIGPENPELWLPLQIVNSQLYKQDRILLDAILGHWDQLYFTKIEKAFSSRPVESSKEHLVFDTPISMNHINDEKWLMIANHRYFDQFTPSADTKEWDKFDKITNVYTKAVIMDDITGKLLQTHCTSLRLVHGWQIFLPEGSIKFLKIAYIIDRQITLTSPDVDCAKMFELPPAENTNFGNESAPQELPIKPLPLLPIYAEEIVANKSESAAANLDNIPLPLNPISQSIDNRDAWIATPKLAVYRDKCIFGCGVFNSRVMTLNSAYLDGKPLGLESNTWSQWTLCVTYVDIAFNPSESKLGVDKLVSSKYKNGKNGLTWKRMVVKSITEDTVKQSLLIELIDGYEVYVVLPHVGKPLLAFGMISCIDQPCALFIQKIRTNGKVENMAARFAYLMENKKTCEIALRESDNYKKPPKKFCRFGKTTVPFVAINLAGVNWTDRKNKCIMKIDDSPMGEIEKLLNLSGPSHSNQT